MRRTLRRCQETDEAGADAFTFNNYRHTPSQKRFADLNGSFHTGSKSSRHLATVMYTRLNCPLSRRQTLKIRRVRQCWQRPQPVIFHFHRDLPITIHELAEAAIPWQNYLQVIADASRKDWPTTRLKQRAAPTDRQGRTEAGCFSAKSWMIGGIKFLSPVSLAPRRTDEWNDEGERTGLEAKRSNAVSRHELRTIILRLFISRRSLTLGSRVWPLTLAWRTVATRREARDRATATFRCWLPVQPAPRYGPLLLLLPPPPASTLATAFQSRSFSNVLFTSSSNHTHSHGRIDLWWRREAGRAELIGRQDTVFLPVTWVWCACNMIIKECVGRHIIWISERHDASRHTLSGKSRIQRLHHKEIFKAKGRGKLKTQLSVLSFSAVNGLKSMFCVEMPLAAKKVWGEMGNWTVRKEKRLSC